MVSATTKQQQHYHISRHRRNHYANHRYKTTVLWIEKAAANATKGP